MRPQPVRVAIDLETTGLNPEQDAIVEIGAVKFAGDRVLDSFQTFINPGIALPYRIQRLTGIKPAALRGAPVLGSIAAALRAFLGEYALVGHNVPFDAGFLTRAELIAQNPLIDTYELASMLLPTQRSYTLAAVADALQVASSTHHRALADAHLSREVFLALMRRLEALSATTIDALSDLAAPPDWTPRTLVRAERQARRAVAGAGLPGGGLLATTLGEQLANRLGMDPGVLTLAVAGVAAEPVVGPVTVADHGAVTDETPPPQPLAPETLRLLQARLERCLHDGGTLVVEAQADTPTRDAHLLAVARWAQTGAGRIVVAVADHAGMAELARVALPRALALLGPDAAGIQVAELGELSAYVCLHRWFGVGRVARDGLLTRDVTRGLAKLAVWIASTTHGQRGEVALGWPESAAWERVRAGVDLAGSVEGCPYRREGYCFVARAEEQAHEATIIVTTHSALARHLLGDTLLPEGTRYVVLDAHVFEEELRRVSSHEWDLPTLDALLANLAETEPHGKRAGLLHLASARVPGSERGWFAQVAQARTAATAFFQSLAGLLPDGRSDSGDQRVVRIGPQTRQSPEWDDVRRAWEAFDASLGGVAALARFTARAVMATEPAKTPLARNGVATDLLASAWQVELVRERLGALVASDAADRVIWLRVPYPAERDGRGFDREQRRGQGGRAKTGLASASSTPHDAHPPQPPARAASTAAALETTLPTLHSTPVHVGPLLTPLHGPGRALVLGGPALAAGGDFEHVRGILNLPEGTQTIAYAADFADQTLLGLPLDVPEPNAPQYQSALDAMLVALGRELGGRIVIIFPSHAALRASATGIRRALERDDVLVLAQGVDGSARQLWHTFDHEPRVALLGAGTFWDGGEHRAHPPACVVVARLPMPALSDPVIAARAEQWPDPQHQFVAPLAALRLRQALNGLAWSHGRKNAVIIFDRRVQTRGYGQLVLSSLPQLTQYQAGVSQLVERVADWVGPA